MEFLYEPLATRVVFGARCLAQLKDELTRLGIERAFAIVRRSDVVAGWAAGVFDETAMHVPVELVSRARKTAERLRADGLVAIGGGSTIGLAKAVALETSLPIVAVPTTYSGSEMTPIWGRTASGEKTTGRDQRVLPKTVLYDPELTRSLPREIAGPSGMNAIAHAVEALYAKRANPVVSLMAEEAIKRLARSLPDDHEQALYGAFLAGCALGAVGMSLHHKLCHILGGSFGLPHAETHTVVLPHAAAYNREAAPEAMARLAAALDADDAATGLFVLTARLDAPQSLRELGMSEEDLDRAAALATERPYDNPRPVTRDGVRQLLEEAFHGRRPSR